MSRARCIYSEYAKNNLIFLEESFKQAKVVPNPVLRQPLIHTNSLFLEFSAVNYSLLGGLPPLMLDI